MKEWKWFIIMHFPKNKFLRKLVNKLYCYRIARSFAMNRSEVERSENSGKDKQNILRKYMKKYSEKTSHIIEALNQYMRNHSLELSGGEYEALCEDVLFCYFAYGFLVDEYFMYQLGNKSIDDRKSYLSDRDMHALIIYKLNDVFDKDILRNKVRMYQHFKKYYKRDAVSIKGKRDLNNYLNFTEKHLRFVEKAARENCGRGVRFIDLSLLSISKEEYFEALIRSKGEYLLEECIIQSEIMQKLNASSVNTVRFDTFFVKNKVRTCCPCVRIGREGSFVDNAANGGLLAVIDVKTGRTGKVFDENNNNYIFHPDSGIKLVDFQLPEWRELTAIVEELARSMPAVRYIGWDFAHTDSGWVMVERNAHAQTHFACQLAEGTGQRKVMLGKAE